MIWIWVLIAVVVGVAGFRRRERLHRLEDPPEGLPRVDDDAVRRILEQGSLSGREEEALDLEEVERAEEEFFDESWDEPEEYRP